MSAPRLLLLIFVKNPRLGKVKTRLARTIGPAEALAVYRQLLLHTRNVAAAVPAHRAVFYAEGPEADEFPTDLFEKFTQRGADLGARLSHAFGWGFAQGYDRIVVVGSDCPELTPSVVTAAYETLDAHEVALGPARDGGYYLLGLRQPAPTLFERIDWSTDRVAAQTRAACAAAGLRVGELPELSDLDEEADLREFEHLLPT